VVEGQLRRVKSIPRMENLSNDRFFDVGNSTIPRVFLIENTLGMTEFPWLSPTLVGAKPRIVHLWCSEAQDSFPLPVCRNYYVW